MGGFFRGTPWLAEGSTKTRHAFAFTWGEVVSTPKVQTNLKKPCTVVTVKYKQKTFIVCKHWGDDEVADAMRNLRLHDMVIIFGRYENTQYVNKQGAEKEVFYLRAEFVLSQDIATFAMELMRSPSLAQLLKMDERYADKIESADEDDMDGLIEAGPNDFEEEIYDDDEFGDIGF